jgi:hypothetical protein
MAASWLRAIFTVARDLLSRKRQFEQRRDLLAAELRHNARVIDEWGGHFGNWTKFRGRLSLRRWQEFGEDLGIFERHNLGLWADLVSMYEKLQYAVDAPAPRLKSEPVRELATRLSEAEL